MTNRKRPVKKEEKKKYGLITGTEIPRTRTKVAIVGFAPTSMTDVRVLFDNPDFEIWGLNQLYIAYPAIVEHCTRWFQIHHRTSYDINVQRDIGHHEWLTLQKNFPIYMQEQQPDVPMSVRFPKEDIIANFGTYFTNSISWEIALACYETMLARMQGVPGFDEMHIYGVDMAQACITPETKVLTSDLRWEEAGNIKVGQKVIGFDENTGPMNEGPHAYRQWRCSEVEEANRLIRPCYKLHLEDGTTLISSDKHLWLTYSEHMMKWKQTDELVTNMHRDGRPTKIVKALDTWKENRSWEAGYLAAAVDGEGFLTQAQCKNNNGVQSCLGFSQKRNGMSAEFEKVAKKLGYNFRQQNNAASDTIGFNICGGKAEIVKFLGEVRPRRLLEKFNPELLGSFRRKEAVGVVIAEYIGEQEVIGFKTSTKTFMADGFASHNSEYQYERPSVEYFIGIAKGLGIKTVVPDKSDLLKSIWLYPYEDSSPFRTKIHARVRELQNRRMQLAQQEQASRDQKNQLIGALDNMQYIEQSWESSIREMATAKDKKK